MKKITKRNKIVILIAIYFFILCLTNFYIRNEYDKIKNDTTAFIIYGKENHQELLNNTKGILSYRQALSFYSGKDNDIIYTPEIATNADGSSYYKEKPDELKLNWRYLSESISKNIILAYSASTCNLDLAKNEVAININEDSSYYSKFLNKEIIFKYNEQLIPLNIKKIENFDIYSLICISDELYNELSNKEENYIYDIKTEDYKTHESLFSKFEHIENNSFFSLSQPATGYPIELSNKYNTLGDLIEYIQILNVISAILLAIFIISCIVNILQKKE